MEPSSVVDVFSLMIALGIFKFEDHAAEILFKKELGPGSAIVEYNLQWRNNCW